MDTEFSDLDLAFDLQMNETLRASSATFHDQFDVSENKRTMWNEDGFKVYFKGLVSNETAGIGVAICDASGCCLFELQKPCFLTQVEAVELYALYEALCAALDLGLKPVHIFCDSNSVYQYLTGKAKPTNNIISTFVDKIINTQIKLGYLGPFLVPKNSVRFAYNLARNAIIASQSTKIERTTSDKASFEQCTICYESISTAHMFSVTKCLHRYCFSCMKKHIEAKLFQGQLPKCPHENCKSELEVKSCKKFLSPKLYDLMWSTIKEASIPPAEKVYCPFPNCSALMSKNEVEEHTAFLSLNLYESTSSLTTTGKRRCVKCQGVFCIDCKIPWHDSITCSEYSAYLDQYTNDSKLKSLAMQKNWRQCIKCKNMVELAAGCYHINCRCGYEFCYSCGAEWINKKPTCKCPLWVEANIVNNHDDVIVDDNAELNVIYDITDDDEESDHIIYDEESDHIIYDHGQQYIVIIKDYESTLIGRARRIMRNRASRIKQHISFVKHKVIKMQKTYF